MLENLLKLKDEFKEGRDVAKTASKVLMYRYGHSDNEPSSLMLKRFYSRNDLISTPLNVIGYLSHAFICPIFYEKVLSEIDAIIDQ